MAGSVYIDAFERFPSGNKLVTGRLLIGKNEVVRADELGLDTIKSFFISPWGPGSGVSVQAAVIVAYGSIGSRAYGQDIGSLNNVRITTRRIDSYDSPGTLRMGTTGQGSLRHSYLAFGG